jgi:hypothetical protein
MPETYKPQLEQGTNRPVDVDVAPSDGRASASERANLVPNALAREMRLVCLLHDVNPKAVTYQRVVT